MTVFSERVPFADDLASHGSRIALVDASGKAITYNELSALADQIELPVEPMLTLLAITPTVQSVATYLALLRSRFPVILVDNCDSRTGRNIRELFKPWCIGLEPATKVACPVNPETAVLLSTSGSTGSAKLVRLSYQNITSNADSIRTYLGITADDRAITSLPLHYSYGLSVLHSHLAAGAAVVLTDASVADPGFWNLFDAQAVTHLAGVPYSYELFELAGLRDRALPFLRTLTQAGGRLPPATVIDYAEWAKDRGVKFYVMYGQTEATARIAYLPPEHTLTHSDCIGVPIPGGTIHLIADDGSETDAGPGELIYSGPNVMMGYAMVPEDLALPAGPTELATGDVAERTADGLYRIVGRMNRFSKLFGLRVSHDEVERWLHSKGVNAMVSGDDVALAVLVEGDSESWLQSEIARRTGLPPAAVNVRPVECFPRLASGKPDYVTANKLASDGRVTGPGVTVAEVFAKTFPGVIVTPDDTFVGLGGDSLSYVTFSMALEDVLGHLPPDWPDLSLRELERCPVRLTSKKSSRSLESDIVIRAIAIASVVVVHTGLGSGASVLPSLGGGAQALMVLFGFNLSRFQLSRFAARAGGEVVRDFAMRVVLPYLVLLLAYGAYRGELEPGSLLLVSAWTGRYGTLLEPYWFIETAAQSVLLLWLAFAFPALGRWSLQTPRGFAWGLIGVAMLLKIIGIAVLDQSALQHRTLDANFLWLALGWGAAVFATRKERLVVVIIGVMIALMDWGFLLSRSAWVGVTLAVLVFLPRLSLPRQIARLAVVVARASFMIYLTHMIIIHELELRFSVSNPAIVLAAAVAFGVAAFRIQNRLEAEVGIVRSRWRGLRKGACAAPYRSEPQ